jgi:hypothetical protein
MNITRDEAVAALRDVESAEARARMARGYRFGAPHLMMWGVIWVIGYAMMGLAPAHIAGALWMVLSVVGGAGGMLLNRGRMCALNVLGDSGYAAQRQGRFWFVGFLAVWLFMAATYVVMRPSSVLQFEVYPALVVGLVYALVGAWGQPRYLWIGGIVAALSLIGYFFLTPILPFWLAAVGGCGLILGGVWLRQA